MRVRGLRWSLLAPLLALGLLLAAPASAHAPAAQDAPADEPAVRGEAVHGRLRAAGEPIVGATIIVTSEGEQVGTATTDEEGGWFVTLPGPGVYEVTLLEDTLPEDIGLRDPERATLQVTVHEGRTPTVIFVLGEGDGIGRRFLPRFLQRSAEGVRLGLVIAMTAVGLSLIFGTTRMINFAHGEMVTFGAIVAWFLNATGPRMHVIAAGMVAITAGGALGGALERGMWRPLRARQTGLFQLLVVTIGLALVIRHLLLIFFGGQTFPYAQYAIQARTVRLGPIAMTPRDVTIMALSTLILVAVATMLQRTLIGKAMRALSDNRDLAEASGIDVQRVVLIVWIMGGALAATGGLFVGIIEQVNYLMGFRLLLLMFAGVILGGLGTAYGAMIGSIVVGLVVELSTLWFPAELKFAWALAALIVILLIRPQGILGQKERIG